MPRCLCEWDVGTGCPPKVSCVDVGVGELESVICTVFAGLKDIIHCSPYWCILSKSF